MKNMIRAELITRRKRIVNEIGNYKELIKENTIPELLKIIPSNSIIAGYYPIDTEFDCKFVLKSLNKNYGFDVCLPIVSDNKTLKFKIWDCEDHSLIKGKYNSPSLVDSDPFVVPDVVLVPMLGFDRDFNRIGYGGGYYDTTLAMYNNCISIGLGFSQQYFEHLVIEPTDVKLQHIITEFGKFA